jgi:DNA-binding transcriptional MerR regulator
MPRDRDQDSGKYTEVYPKSDFIDLLSDTRLSTSEVADHLDCHRTTAFDKLRQYEQEGLLKSTSVGNTLLWELTENPNSSTQN